MATLCEKIFQTVKKYPQKKALGFKQKNKWHYYNYQEFWQMVNKIASELKQNAVEAGERVAILSENRPEWAIADQAAMLIGAVVVPLHTTLSAKYIQYILDDSSAKILFIANQDLLDKIRDVLPMINNLKRIVFFEKVLTDIQSQQVSFFDNWLNSREKSVGDVPTNEDSLASIVYTSGTTGDPKGVMLSHKNFSANIEAALKCIAVNKNDIFLSFLPLSHVLERMAGYYTPLSVGATICYAEAVKKLAENMREVRPTILVSVPRIFEKVYEKIKEHVNNDSALKKKIFYWAMRKPSRGFGHFLADKLVYKKIREKMGGHLRLAISGGASLNEKVARFFEKIGLIVLEGYGLTETSPVISCNKIDNYKFGTVGQVLDNLTVKIMPDKEIAVKGPSVMSGYYQKEDLTKEVLSEDGWFQTGDLGFIDQQGFLTIIGRKKEMITLTNGKTVSPEKIESFITISKYIAQALVIGHKKPYLTVLIAPDWQNLTKMIKQLVDPNISIGFGSTRELVRNQKLLDFIFSQVQMETKNLPDYEQIKKIVLIDREFTQENNELTPTLKLRRDTIAFNFKKEIEKLYVFLYP